VSRHGSKPISLQTTHKRYSLHSIIDDQQIITDM